MQLLLLLLRLRLRSLEDPDTRCGRGSGVCCTGGNGLRESCLTSRHIALWSTDAAEGDGEPVINAGTPDFLQSALMTSTTSSESRLMRGEHVLSRFKTMLRLC
jgi:hypothetical protein